MKKTFSPLLTHAHLSLWTGGGAHVKGQDWSGLPLHCQWGNRKGEAAGAMVALVLMAQHQSIGSWPHRMWLDSKLYAKSPKAKQAQEPY